MSNLLRDILLILKNTRDLQENVTKNSTKKTRYRGILISGSGILEYFPRA